MTITPSVPKRTSVQVLATADFPTPPSIQARRPGRTSPNQPHFGLVRVSFHGRPPLRPGSNHPVDACAPSLSGLLEA
jgi:hypothetical protein